MSSLPLVIVNPASAGGATGEAWPAAAGELRRHFGPFECAFTKGGGDARDIAEREARAGRRLVIACGGDGTLNEVTDGLLLSGADAELGLLPSGTGGDFRRTLGVPASTRDAALALREGRTRLIDAGRVSYKDNGGEERTRHFVNVASCGMSGAVIEKARGGSGAGLVAPAWLPFDAGRLLGGRISYAAAAAQTAFSYKRPLVAFSLDGGPESHLVVTNLCVANARYFGGGMKIAPGAKLDDGLFDVVAVGALGALGVLANSYKLYLGTHLGMRQVRHALARRVEARAADAGEAVMLELDGELVGQLPATFEVLPRALRVRCP